MSRYLKAAAAIATLAIVAAAAWLTYACFVPVAKFATPRVVSVNPGDSLGVVARRLASAGVVRSARAMMLYAELSGGGRNLKPGDYAFGGGEGISDVLRHLVNGDFMVVTVAIPEGTTLHQIAERLEQAGLVCQGRFESRAMGPGARGARAGAAWSGGFSVPGYLSLFTAREHWADTDRDARAVLQRLPSPAEERMFDSIWARTSW